MKYIALLRGINVGGKNKVAMADLKRCFEDVGFRNIQTYINSGNVIFESDEADEAKLVTVCEAAIAAQCGFRVICSVISAKDLQEAVSHAPEWWNKGDGKHNALFVIAPKTTRDVLVAVGEPRHEYEKVADYQPIIFWSAPIETYGRTRFSKIVGTEAYQWVTIRNANTTLKLVELSR